MHNCGHGYIFHDAMGLKKMSKIDFKGCRIFFLSNYYANKSMVIHKHTHSLLLIR